MELLAGDCRNNASRLGYGFSLSFSNVRGNYGVGGYIANHTYNYYAGGGSGGFNVGTVSVIPGNSYTITVGRWRY